MEKKEVKNNIELDFLLEQLKANKNPSQIAKELNISKQKINYYIRQLKSLGFINKIGYKTWEVKNYTSMIPIRPIKIIRGHAFMWKVKLSKKFNWNNDKIKTMNNQTKQITILNRKITLGKKTIIIYENKDFYGINSIESRKQAVNGLLQVLDTLQNELSIKLGSYALKVVKEHYSMIKNELATQYNNRKEKMYIRDDLEGEWLWIDDSDNLNELETKNLVRSKQVQDWWNDNKKYDFKVTPSFLMESINKVTNNQLMFAQNIETHMQVLKDISKAVNELKNEIKKFNSPKV